MSQLILHHYDISPFSEKVRRVLAYKAVPWHAVEQPIMAPKPDLTPLTGGYRRIPVLQIGADIYCDTALMLRKIEELHPENSIYPAEDSGLSETLEDWADHRLFMFAAPVAVAEMVDALPPGFFEDRGAMTPAFTKDALVKAAPHSREQLGHALDQLNVRLANEPFVSGSRFTVADAACFHPVRFLMNVPTVSDMVTSRPALSAWVSRIEAFGTGDRSAMEAEKALTIAAENEPADIDGESVDAGDLKLGVTATVVADDYGTETTSGEIVRIRSNDITLLRTDEKVGKLAVHYPRAGYRVTVS